MTKGLGNTGKAAPGPTATLSKGAGRGEEDRGECTEARKGLPQAQLAKEKGDDDVSE